MTRFTLRFRSAVGGSIAASLLFAIACGSDSSSPSGAAVASIEVTFTGNSVSIGAVQQLSLAFLDNTGHVIPGSHTASWTSSNPAIASVDVSGNVSGVALGGPVTITATADGKSVSTSLSVIPASVVFTPIVRTLLTGTSTHLTAVAQNASQLPIAAGPATWSISPAGIASVDSTGTVTAFGSGTFTVSASIAGRIGTTQILAGVPSIYDGAWSGPMPQRTSSLNATVEFTVIFGTVTDYFLTGVTLGNCGTTTLTVVGTQAITSDQFSFLGQGSVLITDVNGTRVVQKGVSVSGAFVTPTTMSGVFEPGTSVQFDTMLCPSSSITGLVLGSVAYTATKQ